MSTVDPAALRSRKLLAFLILYFVWGSTYLGIRFALETLPPFLMAGVRHLIAGLMLYPWITWRHRVRPRARQWWPATVVGALLLLGGNGLVVWAEQLVPSGLAAVLVATVPIWIVALGALGPAGTKPGRATLFGLGLGFAGVLMLVGPGQMGGAPVHPMGALALVGASLAWSVGSLYSRRADLPRDPLLATAMQMLCGGALLVALGLAVGEGPRLVLSAISLRSALALAYLIVFGSLIGFSAYVWLLRVAPPAQVVTYAYVNPLVAVGLGWLFADEPVGLRTLLAAAAILAGVVLITRRGPARKTPGAHCEALPPCPASGSTDDPSAA